MIVTHVTVCVIQGLTKQSGYEDPFDNGNGDDMTGDLDSGNCSDDDLPPTPPRPSTPVPSRGLPWTPKVRLVTHSMTSTN